MPRVAPFALSLLSRTWRVEVVNEPEELARGECGLIALWHGRMLLGLAHYAGRNYRVLVSPSADGSLVAPLLRRFGYGVVRGSSSRGGARALRELLVDLRSGRTVVLTPDGPRGPRHAMNLGLAWMASATGLPVFPLGLAADRSWHLSSWDHFTIPRPFARVVLTFGATQRLPRHQDEATLARETERVRTLMLDAERRSFEQLGLEPDL